MKSCSEMGTWADWKDIFGCTKSSEMAGNFNWGIFYITFFTEPIIHLPDCGQWWLMEIAVGRYEPENLLKHVIWHCPRIKSYRAKPSIKIAHKEYIWNVNMKFNAMWITYWRNKALGSNPPINLIACSCASS